MKDSIEMSADDAAPDDSYWNQLDSDEAVEAADWSGDELEAAYLKAMEALEASNAQLPELPPPDPRPSDLSETDQNSALPVASTPSAAASAEVPPSFEKIGSEEIKAELSNLAQANAATAQSSAAPATVVTPRQILEALLFVGGEPLTTKRLSHVLRGEFSAEFIESQIDELNALYAREGRPYEIRFGDGGYRLTLRDDFEKIRRKVYGLGPKEVRLSQEVLEVLAVLAYHQPITAAGIEELGKPGCGSVLRQLLRRELICVERTKEQPREVIYRTTPRFLSLFGIRNLNELPRHEQVSYK